MSEKEYTDTVIFIRTLFCKQTGAIPLHAPFFGGNEKKYLAECIDSTFVSYLGAFVSQFEDMVSAFTGVRYAVAVVNGTVALQVALITVGVQPGDEVVTQPLTFVATANAIRHCSADPVFVDVERSTLGMSPDALESFLQDHGEKRKNGFFNRSTGRRIAAIVPMHTFGFPCKIDRIVSIADRFGIPVVEDAAESLGSYYRGRHTGAFGKVSILSFNGNKIITTGGGGMLITDDESLAQKARHLTTTGKQPHAWEFIHDQVAYNYRLTNVNAAIGVAQMEKLEVYLSNKRETYLNYRNFFIEFSSLDFFTEPDHSRSNCWLNTIIFKNNEERDLFLKHAHKQSIFCRPAWRLMHKLDMFKNCISGPLHEAEWLGARIVNLPSSYRST
jgi:aminotransferase in exopolysaccharide biosynthesis